ncbi:hypothetical protein EQG63_04360 [Flavobacterium amnicola]|uniref:Lipoprotein n=1 Tax=Flavobacterium amnicola TaxID=2506422 RepID=A0A4Q1K5U8_9FLAO|nr:hypothetical protein [Flavobacterium amnicola]RXR21178.1 hypothetical protein EQG63_04360 [Flavobacterium amnicola]
MKALYVLFIASLMLACKSSKLDASQNNKASLKISDLESLCPEDGKCTVRLLSNQELVIKADEFGKIYFDTIANKSKSVVLFEYSRNIPEGLQDGSYREEVIFEIEHSISSVNLKNNELGQLKMLYGRHCFCKGYAGYYYVKEGNLILSQKKGTVDFDFNFKIKEVPQVIAKIKTKDK